MGLFADGLMLIVLPFCQKDYTSALNLLRWMKDLDGQLPSVLLIAGAKVQSEQLAEATQVARGSFAEVRCIRQREDRGRPWPMEANAMFALACEWISKHHHAPWLWVEPDAIPVRSGWLAAIEMEYQRAGREFMGARYDVPWEHINGVAVYPANIALHHPMMLKPGKLPFDCADSKAVLRRAHATNLIQRSLADPRQNLAHSFKDADSLCVVNPDAVLFHGCTDGTLIDRLRERSGAPRKPPISFISKLFKQNAKRLDAIRIRRSGALGDALAATCVARKLTEQGYAARFITGPDCRPLIELCQGIVLDGDTNGCDINLDGAYENDPDRCRKSFPEMFIARANEQLRVRKTAITALNIAPELSLPAKTKRRFERQHERAERPWIAVVPRSNSFACRTIPDQTWEKFAENVPGTKFWLGNHGPAPDGLTDLNVQDIGEVATACACADLVVSVDTGPMHIAAALGTQVIAVEQSSSPELHLSDQRDYETVKVANLDCLNCQKNICPVNPKHPPCMDVDHWSIATAVNRKLFGLRTQAVSCVLPVWRPSRERLNTCLAAVIPQVDEVIVCRGQAGQFPEGAMRHPKIRYLVGRHGDVGYGRNMNYGVRHSMGYWVLGLTDDVYLDPEAVAKLIEVAKQDETIGMVGHLLWYPGRKEIQHGGTRRRPGDIGWGHIDHHAAVTSMKEPYECENVTGASVLYRRKAFYDVLGFDERYYLYFEDNHMALSLRKAGWKVWYTPHAQGIHDEHASTKITPNVAKAVSDSKAVFEGCWRGYFDHNRDNNFGNFDY